MGQTAFTGPIVSGDLQQGQANGPNQGYCELVQDVVIQAAGAGTQNYPVYLPAGSTVNDVLVDVTQAFNGSSSSMAFGNVAAGNQYGTVASLQATGRQAVVFTAAQLAAINGVTTTGAPAPMGPLFNIAVTAAGSATLGTVCVTVRYAQLTSSN